MISHFTQKIHRYDNVLEAQKKIEQHLPISVARHQSGKFYMHVQPNIKSSTHAALEITPLIFFQSHMDFDYFHFLVTFLHEKDPIMHHVLLNFAKI
jgi:hypothetical protein